MKNRIYIAGCGGMLGAAFQEEFGGPADLRCTDIDANEPWLSALDFRDLDHYMDDVSQFAPDCLFHLGALTDLEYCEENPDEAYATNTMAVENAVYIANELRIPLLYISTAGIFDGTQDVYDDWDLPRPLGVYARSKYAGEIFVKENAEKYLICRAGWMMGGGPRKDKKFVQKLMVQMRDGCTELHVVDDKMGTPTYTRDFARNVRALLERQYWGLYNMACQGMTSRLEVAQELVRLAGLSGTVAIQPVRSPHFADTYYAPRPRSERLLNRRLALRNLDMMRPWRDALEEYLALDYADYLVDRIGDAREA
jgi:dTDP-4-dehydrorhamnose reductase